MGRDKLLMPWAGTVVIGSVVDALEAGGVGTVVIVTARWNSGLEEWARDRGHRTTVNPAPERGMLSSVWEGVLALGGAEQISDRGESLLVCPGDLPGVDSATVEALVELVASRAAIAVPVHEGRRGHPLAISAPLVVEIPGLDPGVGLRQLVDRHRDHLVELAVGHSGVVRDLDTPADYAAAVKEI